MPPTEEGYSGGVGGSGSNTNTTNNNNNNSMNGPGGYVGANAQQNSQQKSNVVMFDTTKNELYRTSDTYKTLQVSYILLKHSQYNDIFKALK